MKSFAMGLAVAFVAGIVGLRPYFQESLRQPIQFNHLAHNGVDCSACHEFVNTDSFAGLPSLDLCLTCHETPITESPEEEKIRTLARQGTPVEWRRLFRQPAHVFYSHRRHVEIARLECVECHGEIGNSTAPPARVTNLTMEACTSCHEKKNVKDSCLDCHR